MEGIKTIISFDYEGAEADEILRNLSTLYATPAGTIPLDREFGLDQSFLGYPIEVAQNMLSLEIIEKTELYEPRAEVDEVTFEGDQVEGLMIPTIHLVRAEDEDENDEDNNNEWEGNE